MPTADVLAKLIDFGKACLPHLGSNLLGGHSRRLEPGIEETVDKYRDRVSRRRRHVDPQLEPAPDGPIKKLGVVGGSNHNNVTRKLVELHQEERYNALDFAGFVDVSAFLADGIEFVEEEYARHCAGVLEEACEARIGLAEIGSDQRIITHGQEGHGDRLGDRFGKRRFPVSGWSRQQDAVPRLHALGAQ